jgi:hypothetical protein
LIRNLCRQGFNRCTVRDIDGHSKRLAANRLPRRRQFLCILITHHHCHTEIGKAVGGRKAYTVRRTCDDGNMSGGEGWMAH